jgi:hypothetical protein
MPTKTNLDTGLKVMGEIRSASEIAQEKASKLGQLSPEERKRQKEEKGGLIGKMLAEKYFSQHDIRFLQTELSKYGSPDRGLISQAAIRRLVEGIDLRYSLKLGEVSKGILSLTDTEAAVQTMDKINELFREYGEAGNRERQEIERAGREILHQLRISGTAISQINIRAREEWLRKLNELAHPFEERLNSLKQELMSSASV